MRESKRLAAILATVGLLGWATVALDARTKKGDQLYAQGHLAEERKDFDGALKLYEDALAQDPGEVLYQMASRRVRFQSAQAHVDKAEKMRSEGKSAGGAGGIPERLRHRPFLADRPAGIAAHHGDDRIRQEANHAGPARGARPYIRRAGTA